MTEYPDFSGIYGEGFNIEAVCPHYLPESQCVFTWKRDKDGIAIVSGYDPEYDESIHWLCTCGHYETGGGHCTECGNQPPWGCDCGLCNEVEYDSATDFWFNAEYDGWEYGSWEPEFEYEGDEDGA